MTGTEELNLLDDKYLTSIDYFKFYLEMRDKLGEIQPKREQFIKWFENQDKEDENDITTMGERWWGSPLPLNIDDIKDRIQFQRMDKYEEMKPRIMEAFLAWFRNNKSEILHNVPKWKYNDKELGNFDFDRASINLLPRYQYYNTKTKKYLDKIDVANIAKDKSKAEYVQIGTKDKVIVVPILKEPYDADIADMAYRDIASGTPYQEALAMYGLKVGKYYSTVKDCYRYKEKVLLPKKAIRLFITVGGDSDVKGNNLIYSGITGLILAELLEMKGYIVNIQAVYGYQDNGLWSKKYQEFKFGARCVATQVKAFNETIESKTLLYMLSDATFFRHYVFKYFQLLREKYGDKYNGSLGRMIDSSQIKTIIYKHFGIRDGYFIPNKKGKFVQNANTQFLYFFIDNIFTENSCIEKVREVMLDVENQNQIARDQLHMMQM